MLKCIAEGNASGADYVNGVKVVNQPLTPLAVQTDLFNGKPKASAFVSIASRHTPSPCR